MTGTDVLRLVWTIGTFVGMLAAAWNWYDAYGDFQALRQSGRNGVLKVRARAAQADTSLILTALAASFAAGALSYVPAPQASIAALIVSAASLIWLSFSQKRQRSALLKALVLRQGRTHRKA